MPAWTEERGDRLPTRRCPKCGLPDPYLRLRYEHLLANGWKALQALLDGELVRARS